MAYIFVNDAVGGDTVISSLRDLEESDLGIVVRDELDYLPCYVVALQGTAVITDEEYDVCNLLDFVIKEVVKEYGNDRMLTFSVTNKEENHRDWLDAAARYPSAQVQEIHRDNGTRRYTCYFVTIPVSDQPLV